MTEEATNSDPWGPETRTMAAISHAAFEVDDYWRIVNILHKRLAVLDKKSWRGTFKALVLLEYLLTHGPESFAADFRCEEDALHQLTRFQHVDDLGFDCGQSIQRKAVRILDLVNQETLLKEERNRCRRVSRGIRESGNFSSRTSSFSSFERSNSTCNDMPEELGGSDEKGVNQTTEMKIKNYENDFKIYSKGFSSSRISTNITNDNAYHSNNEWQPFQERKISTGKYPSTGHSFSKVDIVNSINNDQSKHQIPVQGNSSPPRNNTSVGFHAYEYRLQSEPWVNFSTGQQYSSPTASCGSEIDPFYDIYNGTTTQCLLSNNHKRSPSRILDFPDSA
jgi:hypothetical protein